MFAAGILVFVSESKVAIIITGLQSALVILLLCLICSVCICVFYLR